MDIGKDIILIDKPIGISSFDVIRMVRKAFNVRKAGHAGTLDPLASGLLIVGVVNGTKKLNSFLKLPKEYEVEILLGEQRTTGDMEGEIVAVKDVDGITKRDVQEVVKNLPGKHILHVPAYSAVKKGGVPLYKRARRGEAFEQPEREMSVISCSLHFLRRGRRRAIIALSMKVESGVYVRSIAEEIGRQLGYPSVVKSLRRTRIGQFSVKDALNVRELEIVHRQ